jgi:hypothetical protein
MDKVQKTAFTDYNAPSSEAFRLKNTGVFHSIAIFNGFHGPLQQDVTPYARIVMLF